MGSCFGEQIKVTVFGESHARAVGVTIDGLPAGIRVDRDALSAFLARRAPGNAPYATARREKDEPEFVCGLHAGHTCGSPVTALIFNTDARPGDYAKAQNTPRPGHADLTAHIKYGGYGDLTGGGHFSGRLTAPLCVAGFLCKTVLESMGVSVGAHIHSILDVYDTPFDPVSVSAETLAAAGRSAFPVLDSAKGEDMLSAIAKAKAQGNSVGGVVECGAVGLPAGVGEPMFGGIENRIAAAVFGIPAVKGIEFGAGFGAARMTGDQHNDPFAVCGGKIVTKTNHHGGALGGISTGMPVIFRAAFKPTPSIALTQQSVDLETMTETTLRALGRHDPCIVPRAVPVVEAAAAMALLDLIYQRK